MDFEWDPKKRLANVRKHGLDFRDVPAVFAAPYVTLETAYRTEARSIAIGVLRGREIAVIYTVRDGRYRIISMRRARHGEREAYRALQR